MSSRFELESVDRFVGGTVGEPGSRTFYLQVVVGRSVVSFKCEKFHIAGLAEHLDKLLVDLPATTTDAHGFPPLSTPVFGEWSVGAVALGYESSSDRIVIELNESDAESVPEDDRGKARFFLSREQARAFVVNGPPLVSAGRPTCRLCGSSIDPEGFNCPCYN